MKSFFGTHGHASYRPQLLVLEDRQAPSDLVSGLTAATYLSSPVASQDSEVAATVGVSTWTEPAATTATGSGVDGTDQGGGGPLGTVNQHGGSLQGGIGGSGIGGGGQHDLGALPAVKNFKASVQQNSDGWDVTLTWTYDQEVDYFQISRDANADYGHVGYHSDPNYSFTDHLSAQDTGNHTYGVTAKGSGHSSFTSLVYVKA